MVSSLECCRFFTPRLGCHSGARASAREPGIQMLRSVLASGFRPAAGPGMTASVQREDEQIARVFEGVVFHGMQVASARLYREKLLRPDRVDDPGTLERRADLQAP